jgi:hypothetical protein
MKVVVRQKYKSFNVQVAKFGTLDDFKRVIASREEVVPIQVYVVFKRKILTGNPKLQDIGITEGSLVDIVISRNSFELTFNHPEELRLTELPSMKLNEGPSNNACEAFIQQEKVRMLTNMGFQIGQARLALQLADNDVQTAASYLPLDDDKVHLIRITRPNNEPEVHEKKSSDKVIEPSLKIEAKVESVSAIKVEKPVEQAPISVEPSPEVTKEERTLAKVREFLSDPKKFKLIKKLLTGIDEKVKMKIGKDPEAIVGLVKTRQGEKKQLNNYTAEQRTAVKRIRRIGIPHSVTIDLLSQTNWNPEVVEQYIEAQMRRLIPGRAVTSRPSFEMPSVGISLGRNMPEVNARSTLVIQESSFPTPSESLPGEIEEDDSARVALRPRRGFRGRN